MEKAIALTLILVLVGLLALTVLQVAYQPVRCYYRCVRLFPLGDPAGWSCPGLCWRLDGGFFFDTVR